MVYRLRDIISCVSIKNSIETTYIQVVRFDVECNYLTVHRVRLAVVRAVPCSAGWQVLLAGTLLMPAGAPELPAEAL